MSKRTNATPGRVIKDEYITCRRYQHAWKPYDVEIDGRFYVESVICDRCKTTKRQRIDARTGDFAPGTSYTYPEGYTLPGGRLDSTERGTLRLINARRIGANMKGGK